MLTPRVAAEEPTHHQVLALQELFVNTPGVRSSTSILEAGAHTSPGARPQGTLLCVHGTHADAHGVGTACRASPQVRSPLLFFPGWASPDLSPASADPTCS